MTDQNSQFFAILTAVGEAKQANANALGVPWTFAQMGVGDANNTEPVPSRTQTRLINERRRAPLNQLTIDPKDASIIIAEQVIPPDVGGWWIREIGLYDSAGDLVAVANCAPSYKPLLAQGTGKTQVVRLNLVVTSSTNVQLKIDPAVVLATRDYVDSKILTVLPPNKTAGTYTMVEVNDRGVVQRGFKPTTLEEYGIVNALKVGVTSYQRPILSGLGYGSAAESGGAIEIREAQEVGASNKSIAYAPRIMMHWTGVVSGDIAMDSVGQLQWKGQKLYHEGNFTPANKADKATTLAGYGITDGMPKGAGGLLTQISPVQGRISAIPETRFIATNAATEDRPAGVTYAAGMHVTWGAGDQCIDFLGALNGQEDFFVRSSYQGAGTFRKLWTDANFTPANKADKATTLAGYGITDGMTKGAGGLLAQASGVQGRISAIPETRFISTSAATEDRPAGVTYAAGMHVTWGGGEQCIDFLGTLNGQEDFFVRSSYLGAGTFRKLWTEANFTPALKADLASPVFTGTPRVPNVATGTASDQAANTKFVMDAISALVASSPSALATLNGLAAALGNDANFATTVTNSLASKAAKATTLGGYGITDGVKVGDYGLGIPINLVGGTDLNTLISPGIRLYGSGDPLVNAPMTGAAYVITRGRSEYPHQEFRRIYQNRVFVRSAKVSNPTTTADWNDWDELHTSGNHVHASVQEAQAGESTTTWISPLRLYQAIRSAVYRATEAALGVVRFATQDEVDAGVSDAVAITPLKLKKHSSVGVGQTWQNLLASRSLNTNYTNTTGRPITVTVGMRDQGAYLTEIYVGGVLIGSWDQPTNIIYTQTFIVPAGATYMVSGNAGAAGGNILNLWTELRA
ncbi:MAG: phage tail protein [Paucimonas sp.]|jgi:phage-related tail fiber protein|nr:phage tail protein [Paucimonas sp.]